MTCRSTARRRAEFSMEGRGWTAARVVGFARVARRADADNVRAVTMRGALVRNARDAGASRERTGIIRRRAHPLRV